MSMAYNVPGMGEKKGKIVRSGRVDRNDSRKEQSFLKSTLQILHVGMPVLIPGAGASGRG